MNRWLPAVALGLVLALAGVALVATLRAEGTPSPAQRAGALAAELRCPDCQGLSVADSPTRSAQEMRRQIGELVVGGASDDDVRAHFVARYGEWVRLAPSAPALWIIPFLVVGLGTAALLAWIATRRGGRASEPAPALSPEERRRIHDEAEALDA